MVAISAFGRFAERIVPAGTGGMHGAFDPPASGQPGADGFESRPTHAKGFGSDEPATAPRDQRYHRPDRHHDPRGHLGGRAQPTYAGGTTRWAGQGHRGYHRQVTGGRLSARASVHARPVAGSISSLPRVDRGM